MGMRWLSAGIGIPAFVAICLWGPIPFAAGVVVLAGLGLVELVRAMRGAGIQPDAPIACIGLIGPVALLGNAVLRGRGESPLDPTWLAFAAAVLFMVGLVGQVALSSTSESVQVMRRSAYGLLCAGYVSLFSGLTLLRVAVDAPSRGLLGASFGGAGLLLTTVVAVWLTDSAALFVGRATGRRKLAPQLSPAKTVEGAVSGLVAGAVGGVLVGALLMGDVALGALAGAMAGSVGQIGDLFESAIKRELGVKDLGDLVPGHGGVLDRFDSLLFAAPTVYFVLLCLDRT